MTLGQLGPLYLRAILCGLITLVFCSGGVPALRYDDSDGAQAPRHFPPASLDTERHQWQPFNNRKLDLFEEQMSSRPRSASAYNTLQHELWDKKMADDEEAHDVSDDVTNFEARKWQSLQDRVAESYLERVMNYLLNKDSFGGSGGINVLPQMAEEYQDDGIEVERRAAKLPDTCGRRRFESSVTKRVVLGHESKAGWPWLVQLTQLDGTQPYCGGTLLSEDFVLTAAHCFDRHEPNEVIVTLGDRDRSKKDGTEQRFRIECVYIHEAYIPRGDYKDDVALVRLRTGRKTVKMNSAVQPACLPPRQQPKVQDMFGPGDECFVVGWGFTDPLTYFNSKHPTILHQARLPILSPKACRDAYGALYTDNMICAGHMTGDHRTDACKGDSGGPLLCRSKEDQWVVWGIVSWGHNYFCNGSPDKPIPTVYTKVEEYLPWIRKRLRLEQCL